MADFALDRPGVWWFAGIVWQSGVLLLLGLAASAALRRRPARAHRVLLLAMAGAIVAPMASQVARIQGWGLWSAVSVDRPGIPGSPAPAIVASAVLEYPVPRPDGLRPEPPDGGADRADGCGDLHADGRDPHGAGAIGRPDGSIDLARGRVAGVLGPAERPLPGAAGRVDDRRPPGHRQDPTGRGRGDGSSRPDRRGAAGARRGPGAPRVSARPLPGRLVLGSSADHPVARGDRAGIARRLGRRLLSRAGALGSARPVVGTARRAARPAPCRGIRWRGWPDIG